MCLNYLSNTDGGQPCGECGTDNPRNARFCGNCGGTLDAGAVPAPSGSDLAARVVEAVGGAGVALGGDVGGGSSYADVADMGAEPAGDELAPAELTGLVPDKPAPDEPLPEEIPGPMLEAPAQESAVGLGADEDFEIPAPPGVVESAEPADDDFAPPPPPGVVGPADADEFSAPPPPPGALDASDDDFAPPPPPGAIDAGEDEAVPPPPPPPPPRCGQRRTGRRRRRWSGFSRQEEGRPGQRRRTLRLGA